MSGVQAETIDRQVNTLVVEAQARAAAILKEHKDDLLAVRNELLEKKTIESDRVLEIIADFHKRYPDAAPPRPSPEALPDKDGNGQKKDEAPKKGKKAKE